MKKLIVLILCAFILMIALVACTNTTDDLIIDPIEEDPVDSELNDTPDETIDTAPFVPIFRVYDEAFATYSPDTVMIRNEGLIDVTWAELFSYMRPAVGALSEFFGDEPVDWYAQWDDELSCAEWVLQYAKDQALFNQAVEFGANLFGITLSEYDLTLIREENIELAMQWGSVEAFLEMLWEHYGIYSHELFDHLNSFIRLSELLIMEIHSEITDEEIADLTANDGYIMIKHIYLNKHEYGGFQDASQLIEDILERVKTYNGEDFETFFDELIKMYSDDIQANELLSHGYLFRYGDVSQYFFEAAASLEINEFSGIIDSGEGYHIMYRIPINYDAIPFSFIAQNDHRSLRSLVAHSRFNVLHEEWFNMLKPEFTDEFYSIDIRELFLRA